MPRTVQISQRTLWLLGFLVRGCELALPWKRTWNDVGISRQKFIQWSRRCVQYGSVFARVDGVYDILRALRCRPDELALNAHAIQVLREAYPGEFEEHFRVDTFSFGILAQNCADWIEIEASGAIRPKTCEWDREAVKRAVASYSGPEIPNLRLWLSEKLSRGSQSGVQVSRFDAAWLTYNGSSVSTTELPFDVDEQAVESLGQLAKVLGTQTDRSAQPPKRPIERDAIRNIAGRWRGESQDVAVPEHFDYGIRPRRWRGIVEIEQHGRYFRGKGIDATDDEVEVKGHLQEGGNFVQTEYTIKSDRMRPYGCGVLKYRGDGRTCEGWLIGRETGHDCDLILIHLKLTREDVSA